MYQISYKNLKLILKHKTRLPIHFYMHKNCAKLFDNKLESVNVKGVETFSCYCKILNFNQLLLKFINGTIADNVRLINILFYSSLTN